MMDKEYILIAFFAGLGIGLVTVNILLPHCDACPECKKSYYNDCFTTWEVDIGNNLIPMLFKIPISDTEIDIGDTKTSTCEVLMERCTSELYSSTCEWDIYDRNCRCYVISKELVNANESIHLNTKFNV